MTDERRIQSKLPRDRKITSRPPGLPARPVREEPEGEPGSGAPEPLVPLPFETRYGSVRLLGRGGMGEVHARHDKMIGREVAMKVIAREADGANASLARRFVREARIQGQLEHPAIVPVYDFGVDPDGALYFTMKRIRGASLAEVLAGLRDADEEIAHRYSLRRLLTLFANVCMAVHFANEKGVVHRDLKPANIMFGDFGEVYVLDWGVASILGEAPVAPEERIDPGHGRHSLTTGAAGTLGYMAPEQLGPPYEVDARADVYALGAILFEILTLEQLHLRDTSIEVYTATLLHDGESPDRRAPDRDVPPELDQLCRDATRVDRASRLPSAEAMARAIDAYLDGDRDLARRRALAEEHATRADEAVASANREPGMEASERARAMREVATALALDATHERARSTLVRLITEPPRTIPDDAKAAIDASRRRTFEFAARAALAFYFGYLVYIPLLLWMGVRDRSLFALGWSLIALCASTTYYFLRRAPNTVDVPFAHLVISTFTVGAVSVMFGPFVLVPMLALGNAVAYLSAVGDGRGLVPIATSLAVVVPSVLRWVGILPDTYVFANGTWTILPAVFHIKPVATEVFLLTAIVGTLVPASMFVARLRRAYTDAELRLELQAWQLRQIVPEETTAT